MLVFRQYVSAAPLLSIPIDQRFAGNARPQAPHVSEPWGRHVGAVDLVETDDEIVVQMTAPGLRPEDVSVQEQQGMLTIRVDHQAEDDTERDGFHFEVKHRRVLQRTFHLPAEVNSEHATASLRDGVLTISLPKARSQRARRIAIQPSRQPLPRQAPARSWLNRIRKWWRRPLARATHATA